MLYVIICFIHLSFGKLSYLINDSDGLKVYCLLLGELEQRDDIINLIMQCVNESILRDAHNLSPLLGELREVKSIEQHALLTVDVVFALSQVDCKDVGDGLLNIIIIIISGAIMDYCLL